MATYAIARTAKRNPDINGRTLYLTNIGMWTLNPAGAQKFRSREDALRHCRDDDRVEQLEAA